MLLKNAWNKYHNEGGKQRPAKYYKKNTYMIKFEAKNKYKNMSEKKRRKKENIKEKGISCLI